MTEPMREIDENTLIAYADGELPPDAAREVEAHLRTNEDARKMVETMRLTNALVKEAFDAPAREPAPQALIDAIMRAPAAGENVSRFSRLARRRLPMAEKYALPLAASLALAAGLSLGLLIGGYGGGGATVALGPLAADSPAASALFTQASGVKPGPGEGDVAVVASFRDRSGRLCREFETLSPRRDPVAAGVACLNPDKRWTVVGATSALPGASEAGYTPSGTDQIDPLDTILSALGAGEILSAEEEKALIAGRWAQTGKE